MIQEQALEEQSLTPKETEKSETQSLEIPLPTKPFSYYQDLIWDICQDKYPEQIEIARIFHDRTKNEYDNHVSVEGNTGSGKSMETFVQMHLGYKLKRRLFNITKHCIFVPDEGELKQALDNIENELPFWVDEAVKALDKHFWYKIEQIQLNHRAKTERWKCNTIFYNMQRFSEFTESFRNSNIQFRLVVIPRYAVSLRIKDEDPDIEDPWHTKDALSRKYKDNFGNLKYRVALTPDEKLNNERKVPNYHMDGKLLNLNDNEELKEYWNYYKALRDKAKTEAKAKQHEREEKADTVVRVLQKESFKGWMKYDLKINPNLKCHEWYANRSKFIPLSRASVYSYWSEVQNEGDIPV